MRPERRRVRGPGRPNVYGRPQPVRGRRPARELKLNLRAIVSLIVIIVVIIWWWRFFSVRTISVEGSRNYSSSLVTGSVRDQLHSHWWWRNLTLLDTRHLQANLLKQQPQLASLDISRHWPSQLTLNVTERNPNMLWRSGDQLYVLSSEGIVTAQVKGSAPKLPIVEDTTNLPVKLGSQVVPERFVSFSLELIRLLPKHGLQVTNLKVSASTTEVYAIVNQGYYIKFDTTREASSEVGDLTKVLALLKSQNKKPAEYIDLRIEGKAYYK